jgi:hypothetical protein
VRHAWLRTRFGVVDQPSTVRLKRVFNIISAPLESEQEPKRRQYPPKDLYNERGWSKLVFLKKKKAMQPIHVSWI